MGAARVAEKMQQLEFEVVVKSAGSTASPDCIKFEAMITSPAGAASPGEVAFAANLITASNICFDCAGSQQKHELTLFDRARASDVGKYRTLGTQCNTL